VTPDEERAILAAVPAVLSEQPQTREQLADAVVNQTGNRKLRKLLLSGWGALLKPSAFRGDLCFGPNQGQNVTFVRPNLWLGSWENDDPTAALYEMARRFLTTYGPATLDEFARWWGTAESEARKVFKALAAELTEVTIEGWRAWVLQSTLEKMQQASAPSSLRLLPHFDPYTIAVARHSAALLPAAARDQVYRVQGWISPVVLVDGRIAGVWERSERSSGITLAVSLFSPESAIVKQGIEREAERLSKFLGAEVAITGLP
jgi:hypothetical protein